MCEILKKVNVAKDASRKMAVATTKQKNEALEAMASALKACTKEIVIANRIDLENGLSNGLSKAMLDRLTLTPERIAAFADGLVQVAALNDPVGRTISSEVLYNGVKCTKVCVPLGVVAIIYEARPNVTVDAAGLCLKTGNSVVLRGSSSALNSNRKIVKILKTALTETSISPDSVQLIEDPSRESVAKLLSLHGKIDVVIPRGGAGLIRYVLQNSSIPVIETGAGICHTYIDAAANFDMAKNIVLNAKAQRPSVCNAMETLLVHKSFAEKHLQSLVDILKHAGVELRGDSLALNLAEGVKPAVDEDWDTEYNDYILNIRVVDGLDAALEHISRHGTNHSECIVTDDVACAERFLQEVDAAAVYHNASTRFTDGFEFGLGAEIGISTQKLHARGPMGLEALTSYKFCLRGEGQVRE